MSAPVIVALVAAAWVAVAVALALLIGGGVRVRDGQRPAEPAAPEPVACPDWCTAEHGVPGTSCYRTVSTLETPTAWLEVELSRSAYRPGDLEIHLAVFDPATNAETVTTLTPGEAGALAEMIAAAGGARLSGAIGAALNGESGWLAAALSLAATLAGYEPGGGAS